MAKNKKIIVFFSSVIFFYFLEKTYTENLDDKIIASGAKIDERIKSGDIKWDNTKWYGQCILYYSTYFHKYQTCLKRSKSTGKQWDGNLKISEYTYKFRSTCKYLSLFQSCFLFGGDYFSAELPRRKSLFKFNRQGEITWRYQDQKS